jgi:hypothetical protein
MDSTMVFGRQQVDRDWLVGSNNAWGEVGRAWTGVNVKNGAWDFFVGRLDLDTVGEFQSGSDQHLAYAGYSHKWGRTSVYYKSDRNDDDSIYTLGHEWKQTAGNVNLSINAATQWGRSGGSDLSAWAGIAKASIMMGDRMSLYGAYSTASGGTTAAGTVKTFDELYPTDQHRLGMMGLQALSNVRAFSVGLHYMVNEQIGLGASYHAFSLFDEDDFWYNTRNVYGNPYGTGFGTSVGSEFDFTLNWKMSEMVNVRGGFGFFDPGTFIENAAAAGLDTATDNSTFMFVGVNVRY